MLRHFVLCTCLVLSSLIASRAQTIIPACDQTASSVPVPAAWYALPSGADPTAVCGGAAVCNYGWQSFDSNDTPAVQAIHKNLIALDATNGTSQFINLTATSGPNAISSTSPFLSTNLFSSSAGDITAGTSGWSFEFTFKITSHHDWSKIMDFGNNQVGGNCRDDILFGTDGGNNDSTIDSCDSNGNQIQQSTGVNYALNTWYHAVIVFQDLATPQNTRSGKAHWYFYSNGVTSSSTAWAATMPNNVYRSNNNLGRSSWNNDARWSGFIRTFRIYRHALSAGQVNALYLNQMGANCPMTLGPDSTVASGSGNGGPASNPGPIYQLPNEQPASAGQGYQWLARDPADTSCRLDQWHQGLIQLGGGVTSGSFVNLAAVSGPNSVSSTALPMLGGAGSGSLNNNDQGWSFEVTFKPTLIEHYGKLFDIGTGIGICNGDFSSGWTADSSAIEFGICDTTKDEAILNNAILPLMNQWTHVVYVIQYTSNGLANYYSYVNGQLQNSLPMVRRPDALVRNSAFLGKSIWADPTNFYNTDWYFEGLIDTFNVYDRAISPRGALSLFNAASNNGQIVTFCPVSFQSPDVVDLSTRVFSATFSNDPTQAATSPLFGWTVVDSSDSANDRLLHQGLLVLGGAPGGGDGPYVNFTATSGPNYMGQTLSPTAIGGLATAGNVLAGNAGFSIEIVFKATGSAIPGWSKLMDFSGPRASVGTCSYDVFFGWHGSNAGQFDFQLCDLPGKAYGPAPFTSTVQLNQWYHVVATVTMTPTGQGKYVVYLNGNAVNTMDNQYYPTNLPRPHAVLGQSEWKVDPYWQGMVDTFNIYNVSLSPYQVFGLYETAMVVPTAVTLPTCSNAATQTPIPRPWFELDFAQDPRPTVVGAGNAANYGYLHVDQSDTQIVQNVHQGLLFLNGGPGGSNSGYVNLSTTTGPDSVGVTLPDSIGGDGNPLGSARTGSAGWSFEVTFKPLSINSWAKLFDFGNPMVGPDCRDDILFGWNGDTNLTSFTYCDSNGQQSTIFSNVPIVLNTWNHVIMVIQQLVDTDGKNTNLARYSMYVNGNPPSGGLGSTSQQVSGPLPTKKFRMNADLGKSSWGNDGYFAALLDSLNIYNYALSSDQVTALYLNKMGGCTAAIQDNVAFSAPVVPSGTATAALSLFYSLPAQTKPSNGNAAAVIWQTTDPEDATCALGQLHNGMFSLIGDPVPNEPTGPHLNLAQASGPNSVGGPTLGIVGGNGLGDVNAGTAGWTFEFSFKAKSIQQWAKLWDIGGGNTGPSGGQVCHYDIVTGWNNWGPQMTFYTCDQNNGIYMINDAFGSNIVGSWVHAVAVVQANADGTANYYTYRDGKLVGSLTRAYLPPAVQRPDSYIGRSDWENDQYWDGLIDVFNIYNVAASPAQVLQLFNSRTNQGAAIGMCPSSPAPPQMPAEALFLDLSFETNPASVSGPTPGYGWMSVDPTDTASNQALRRGILTLDGNQQFVNLSATSGSNYIGKTIDTNSLGGRGNGFLTQSTVGWTFEIMYKATSSKTFGKLFDIGAGTNGGKFEVLYGQFNTAVDQYTFQIFDYNNNDNGDSPAVSNLALNTWYHIVIVIQQLPTGQATYTIYRNGEQVYTKTNAWYIQRLPRPNADLGRSDWNDANWQGYIDTFRIYQRAATQLQSQNLWNVAAGLPINNGNTDNGNGNSGGSSSLSGGAIAGAVIGSVLGAVILLIILFCLCCRTGGSVFKSSKKEGNQGATGRFDQMTNDVEMSTAEGERMEE